MAKDGSIPTDDVAERIKLLADMRTVIERRLESVRYLLLDYPLPVEDLRFLGGGVVALAEQARGQGASLAFLTRMVATMHDVFFLPKVGQEIAEVSRLALRKDEGASGGALVALASDETSALRQPVLAVASLSDRIRGIPCPSAEDVANMMETIGNEGALAGIAKVKIGMPPPFKSPELETSFQAAVHKAFVEDAVECLRAVEKTSSEMALENRKVWTQRMGQRLTRRAAKIEPFRATRRYVVTQRQGAPKVK